MVADRTELNRTEEALRDSMDQVKLTRRALHETEEQLRQAQKMEAIGQLAGGVAHDFNNMLSVILSYTSLMNEEMTPDNPMRKDLQEIHKAGERATALTRQLLAFSRRQVLAPTVLDLNRVIDSLSKMLGRLIGENIELRVIPGANLDRVSLDQGQFEQVLMNLVVNARDAMPRGGRITIETSNVDLDHAAEHPGITPGPHVMVSVRDTGEGMDRATQERIFEPFFTTKDRSKGTGLGLAVVFGIVKQSGGSIQVSSTPGQGSTFELHFPRTTQVSKISSRRPAHRLQRGSETILLIEDEEQVRVLARNILQRGGYKVIEATTTGEARRLCEQHGEKIHLLLSDVVMPDVSGPQLAQQLEALRPDMRVLFMSGYTDATVVHHGVQEASLAFLQKPLTPAALLAKVREVLDTPRGPDDPPGQT